MSTADRQHRVGADAVSITNFDQPAVRLTKLLNDREAEPTAAGAQAARSIEPEKRLEDCIATVRWNTRATVNDVNLDGLSRNRPSPPATLRRAVVR